MNIYALMNMLVALLLRHLSFMSDMVSSEVRTYIRFMELVTSLKHYFLTQFLVPVIILFFDITTGILYDSHKGV